MVRPGKIPVTIICRLALIIHYIFGRAGIAQPQTGGGHPVSLQRGRVDPGVDALLAVLFQTLADQGPLEFRQVVDEDLAFQVVHLMLDAHPEQSLGLQFDDVLFNGWDQLSSKYIRCCGRRIGLMLPS